MLGQDVARFQIGNQQNVSVARHLGLDALDFRRHLANGVIHRQRPVQQPAGDLPPVGHLAQRGGVGGRGDLDADGFHRRQNRHLGFLNPQNFGQINGVLADVALVVERGIDVDRGVGDQQQFVVGRHVHAEHMADPALGANAGIRAHRLVHQFIGVQTALHQHFRLTVAHQFHRFGGGGVAVWNIHDLEPADVELVFIRRGANFVRRPD